MYKFNQKIFEFEYENKLYYYIAWNFNWQCWWVRYSKSIKRSLKNFNLILINIDDVLTDFNKINKEVIIKYVEDNKQKIILEV